MRYKNRLAGKIAEQEEFEQQQQKLRKKYEIRDEEQGIIRVEKKRSMEILLDKTIALLKTALGILHIILSTIGGVCLLYPDTRSVLYILVTDWIEQALQLTGIGL